MQPSQQIPREPEGMKQMRMFGQLFELFNNLMMPNYNRQLMISNEFKPETQDHLIINAKITAPQLDIKFLYPIEAHLLISMFL